MYRSALEVTRQGELQISIPENVSVCVDRLPEFPSHIKRSSRLADALARRDKISKIVSMLKDTYFDSDPTSAMPFPKLFTVKIDYELPTGPKEGVVFRQRAATDCVVGSTFSSSSEGQLFAEDKEHACVYTLNKGASGVVDPHGVRCWLPCVDHPNQRPTFDLTISAPAHMAVTCSGRLIDSKSREATKTSPSTRAHRYFTVNRIPASSVGFFVGLSEQYTVPLYRTIGHTWVARGLMDYIPTRNQTVSKASKSTAQSNLQSQMQLQNGPNKKARLAAPQENRNPNQKHTAPVGTINNRNESEDSSDNKDEETNAVIDTEVEEAEDTDIMKAEHNLRGGRLYREHVRHSTLGLDLAMRLIHKHTQRRYEHPQYTQIFVYGLEEDTLSFDGFSLIDAR